ncbi:hypothetical protein CONPUDRAFT_147360 [Coniophora puteana RWD-64-598 SS2]|uniref:Uncharacterized protein n=1 Tax=Coniophora puteana (strain RWD-64-598) TaxID=741705 RepID=A0A5M3M8Y5_CONPW|nr:uncharacterized protein CONPUDRAFT_147360 [Coniophora puteana RWD-64-598 SS2]EIW75250.1 hypothetical protein CONPUDRAFT_147360 [Coniophora puteana RWD-64-598 SS2]
MSQPYTPVSDTLSTVEWDLLADASMPPPTDVFAAFADASMPPSAIFSTSQLDFEEWYEQDLGLNSSSFLIDPIQPNPSMSLNDAHLPALPTPSRDCGPVDDMPPTLSSNNSTQTSPSIYGTPLSTAPSSNTQYLTPSPPSRCEEPARSHPPAAPAGVISNSQALPDVVLSEPRAENAVSYPSKPRSSDTPHTQLSLNAASNSLGSSYSTSESSAGYRPIRPKNPISTHCSGANADFEGARRMNAQERVKPLLNAYPTGRAGESTPMPEPEGMDRIDFRNLELIPEWANNVGVPESVNNRRCYGVWVHQVLKDLKPPPLRFDDDLEWHLEMLRRRCFKLLADYDPATFGKDGTRNKTRGQDVLVSVDQPVKEDETTCSESSSGPINPSPHQAQVSSLPNKDPPDAQTESTSHDPFQNPGQFAVYRHATGTAKGKRKASPQSTSTRANARAKRSRPNDNDTLFVHYSEESTTKQKKTSSASTTSHVVADVQPAVSSAGHSPSAAAAGWVYPQPSMASGNWRWDGGRRQGHTTEPRTMPHHPINSAHPTPPSGYHRHSQYPPSTYGPSRPTSFAPTSIMASEAPTPTYPGPGTHFYHPVPTPHHVHPYPTAHRGHPAPMMSGYGHYLPNSTIPAGQDHVEQLHGLMY